MSRTWRSIPRELASRVIGAALAFLALSSSVALAQSTIDAAPCGLKSYVLTAPNTWGPAQDAAVRKAGGMVQYSHAASGIGVAVSTNCNFLYAVLKGPAFTTGGEDLTVQWVEPSHETIQEDTDVSGQGVVTPGDDRFINYQWNMTAIDAFGAWSLGFDGAGVRIAVIDGGMCSAQPDLINRIDVAASRSFVPGFAYDEDATGSFHACIVAAIIAAEDNAGARSGVIGVAPKATIIGCKALHNGSGSFGAVIQAILYASDPLSQGGAGADIINMSLGALFGRGGGDTGAGPLVAAMAKAVNYATAHNVLVVCAAGNNGVDLDHSGSLIFVPAQSGSALAISATGPTGFAVNWPNGATNFRRPASYTNYGNSAIWLAAPGGDDVYQPDTQICSGIPSNPPALIPFPCWVFDMIPATARDFPQSVGPNYITWGDGTSFAAPHVSGVAALVKQRFPGISVGDLKTWLAATADDEGKNGNDAFYGKGFVNAYRAVSDPVSMANGSLPALQEAPGITRVDLAVARARMQTGATFTFSLPTAGQTRLELFDVSGRTVAVAFNGPASAGHTTVAWDGRGVSGQQLKQGAYFARLISGGVSVARKFVLIN